MGLSLSHGLWLQGLLGRGGLVSSFQRGREAPPQTEGRRRGFRMCGGGGRCFRGRAAPTLHPSPLSQPPRILHPSHPGSGILEDHPGRPGAGPSREEDDRQSPARHPRPQPHSITLSRGHPTALPWLGSCPPGGLCSVEWG